MKRILARGFKKGFTLVELLIVIGLLGAIALIVIAAINPIEQANRARDTRFKADGGQLLSAIERYFTSKSDFPWVTTLQVVNNDAAYGFVSTSTVGVGVCADAACADGEIMTSLELKSEFKNRDFIKKGNAADDTQKIFIGKASGASSSVYACYFPMSKSNRDTACANDKVYTISASAGTRTPVTCTSATVWTTASGWRVCIPE